MNIIVRFYWQYNLDLVALAMHPDFDMSYWVKQAVTAEARGIKDFSIPPPESQPYSIDLESNYIHFQLDPEEDDDVISYILGIRYGFRNSAIKIIFRKYLCRIRRKRRSTFQRKNSRKMGKLSIFSAHLKK